MGSRTGFEVIPSIDVLDGQQVRLAQGRYDDVTVYERNPADAARRWAAFPIRRFHVVDLDGARDGARKNERSIRAIVAAMGDVPVQLGGGVRCVADAEAALALGIDRVVMGTVALKQPQVVRDAAKELPGRIVLGIDARDGRVAVEGWMDVSEMTVTDMARRFEDAGVAAIVYTDIGRDGMLTGANLEATAALAESVQSLGLRGRVKLLVEAIDERAGAAGEFGNPLHLDRVDTFGFDKARSHACQLLATAIGRRIDGWDGQEVGSFCGY